MNNKFDAWVASTFLFLLYVRRCMVSLYWPHCHRILLTVCVRLCVGKEVCQLYLRAPARCLAAGGISYEGGTCSVVFTTIVSKWQKLYYSLKRGCAGFACVSLAREELRPQILGVWVVRWWGNMRAVSARIGLAHGKLARCASEASIEMQRCVLNTLLIS